MFFQISTSKSRDPTNTILEPTQHPEVVHIESQLLSQSWPPPKHWMVAKDDENPLETVKKPQNLTWIHRIYQEKDVV